MSWACGVLYRHENNSTVAMEILTRFYIKERDTWSLKVAWWNIGSKHKPWPLGIQQRIRLPAAARTQWRRLP